MVNIGLHGREIPTFSIGEASDANIHWLVIHTKECDITFFYDTQEEIDKAKQSMQESINAS